MQRILINIGLEGTANLGRVPFRGRWSELTHERVAQIVRALTGRDWPIVGWNPAKGQHLLHECAPGCDCDPYCRSIRQCTICEGTNESMPTECLGRKLTRAERDDIITGVRDFRGGVWVAPGINRSYPGQELTAAQRDDLNTGVRLASIFGGKQR